MKKRFQIFVSSTFRDLSQKRSEVIAALLKGDFMPSAMEFFPSTDARSWTLIKGIMEDCDYFLSIVGESYGFELRDGIGFIEKEYNYARTMGIPILAFVRDIDRKPPRGATLKERRCAEKLANFIERLRGHNWTKWRTTKDLVEGVVTSLHREVEASPRPGWIRTSNFIPFVKAPAARTGMDTINVKLDGLDRRWKVRVFLQVFEKAGKREKSFDGLKKGARYEFERQGSSYVLEKRDLPIPNGTPCKFFCLVRQEHAKEMYSILCENFFAVTGRGHQALTDKGMWMVWFLSPHEPLMIQSTNVHTANHSFCSSAYPRVIF